MEKIVFINLDGGVPTPTANGPVRAITSDGPYYVKFFDSFLYGRDDERYKELINEYICFELAQRLELPIPKGALVVVPEGVCTEYERDGERIVVRPSVSFGSKNIDGIVTAFSGPQDIMKCSNKQDLLPIMVFDAWIHNVDRDLNYSNTMFERLTLKVFIIDHGNVFGSGNLWNFGCLPNDQDGEIVVDAFHPSGVYEAFLESVDLRPFIVETKRRFSTLDYDIIKSIIDSVPTEWFLSKEDADALLEYLASRLNHIDDYIELIFERGGRKDHES